MVGSWPCTVSSEVNINGRRVSKPVREDKGKVMVPKLEDGKDQKRARMVLSKGHEVLEPGYSRLSRDAACVVDRGDESSNPNRVDQVHWEYNTDQWTNRVTQDSRGNRDGYSSQRADRVTQDNRGNQDYNSGWQTDWVTWDSRGNRDGGLEQQADRVSRGNRDSHLKSRNSSRVTENLAHTENWGIENLANTDSRVTENSANMESQVTKSLVNEESQVTQHSVNTEHWDRQDSESKNPEVRNDATLRRRPAPQWCLRGITKTQKHRPQKMHQIELAEKKEEEEQDYWFNRLWPMTRPEQTWQEKRLAKEEGSSSSDNSGKEVSKVTLARREDNPSTGDVNPESGDCNPESGNYHPKSGNCNPNFGNSNLGKENDRQGEEPVPMDVNMLFTILVEFCVPTEDVVELALGAECVVFEKPENLGVHMKPLFIRGHLDGTPIRHMLVDGGASVNILPLPLFKKLDHVEGDLKRTNLSHSDFVGEPTEAKGIICKKLMVGSKTVPTAFFVVDVKGCYNMLLEWDWIHANECVPSTLYQCVIQWIGDEVGVVQANKEVCVAVAESQVDILGGKMECLSSKDLMGYDYISIGKDGFVPISVKPMIGATWLAHGL
jgi:hypothetical protein